MSATIHTALYKDYFNNAHSYYGDMECLSVGVVCLQYIHTHTYIHTYIHTLIHNAYTGVRRFPVKIMFLEDIVDEVDLPPSGLLSCYIHTLYSCMHTYIHT